MPKQYPKGSESRLSREGLRGARLEGTEHEGKVVKDIWAHKESRRQRTVKFTDGTEANMGIFELVGHLIKGRVRTKR